MSKLLWEIEYQKRAEGTEVWVRRKMQIPADTQANALVRLGQITHEDNEVNVLEVKPANAAAILAMRGKEK